VTAPSVVVIDYGSGNLRSVERALTKAGASVEVTADRDAALNADGVVLPGVGAFAWCIDAIREVGADRVIGTRLAGGRPVLGICVGMQVMFEHGVEHGVDSVGLGEWPGTVDELTAPVLPHMGWNTVRPPADSHLFAGLADERFYFVHSYAARSWELDTSDGRTAPPMVTWSEHGEPFIAAVENGPLSATQFHPEKSGDAGIALLTHWLETL
jgi:glutamine amidotransferase